MNNIDFLNHFVTHNRTIFVILVGVFSLLVGSFLNVVIYRLPQMLLNKAEFDLALPRSHCPHCQTTLAWYENIPLLSFILLKGQCQHCSQAIAWRYPLVEAVTLIASLIIALVFSNFLQILTGLLLTWSLIPLFVIDLEHMLLPNVITLPLLLLGLLVNYFQIYTSFLDALVACIFSYGLLWIVALLFKNIRKQEGLGGGDVKLLAALGAWFGLQALPYLFIGSSLLALITMLFLTARKRFQLTDRFPFGCFIVIIGWLVLLHQG